MSRLPHPEGSPYEILGSEVVGATGQWRLRRDSVQVGDSGPFPYAVLEGPAGSSFMVPVDAGGRTVLVRQWRYAWGESSWEVPAGTMEAGEEPLACAQRELVEEAGLRAGDWMSLGFVRGSAVMSMRAHLFLARGLTPADRSPEVYEQDMEILWLPLSEALHEGLTGGIVHAGSVAALCRAARVLGL